MSALSTPCAHPAGTAFDRIAEQYDTLFTDTLIGRAQRDTVWEVLRREFRAGDRVLELNCGTGEDALFLSRMGVSVHACDASGRMIAIASGRIAREALCAEVQLEVRATEELSALRGFAPFDGVLSNFSGLNCISDLASVARELASLVKAGGRLVLCLSSRFCLWETIWYTAHGKLSRASRRWKGRAAASLGELTLRVQYPTVWYVRALLSPAFALRHIQGVGVTVPPSYVEHLARKFPTALRKLHGIDRVVSTWPVFRSIGDHVLLVLERTSQ